MSTTTLNACENCGETVSDATYCSGCAKDHVIETLAKLYEIVDSSVEDAALRRNLASLISDAGFTTRDIKA